MRTTIRFNEQLLIQAKKLAAERGITLTALLEDALREAVHRRKSAVRLARVRLTTSGRGGVQTHVDLDDAASLLDLMKARDSAH
jgi:hypothetical protein